MATSTQTVIIDFQADFSSVQDAVEILEKTGKVDAELAATFRKTNQEINKQGQALDKTAQAANKDVQTFSKLSDLMKQFPKSGMNRFLLQVGNELAAAGVKATDFYNKLDPKDAVSKQTTLRQELKNVKDQMQQAALSGGVLGEEYKKLKARAGELDDTIKDVANDISNAGSDTRGIDNVVGSISALAGGYSAVQGAAALFGEENEDLQKALLKVNAAMAFATGLQQVSNALTKQGSIARLADAVATGTQTASQRLYTLVVGQSVGALKLFRIALASTGIGLLVIGLGVLISKMSGASKATKNLKKDLEDLRAGTDAAREGIQQQGEITIALLEQQGVKSSQLSKERLTQLNNEQAAEQEGLNKLLAKRKELSSNFKKGDISDISARIKGIKEVETAIDVSEKNIADLRHQIQVDSIKQQTEENKERVKDIVKTGNDAAEKLREAAAKQRALDFEDYKAGIELKLLAAEKGSSEELDLQKQLLRAKLQIDLEGEDLTINQRKLLIQQFFKDRIDLEKKFNKELVAAGIADEKNRLAAQLENLNLLEEDKLAVKISYLQLSAAEEIAAAEGNASKVLAINAKLNADIVAAKIESIRKAANDEAALLGAQGGSGRRALESVSANEKLKSDIRINAIRQLAVIESNAIDRQIKANRDAAHIQGSDQQALAIEYAQLLDQKAAATEATERKITDITERENQARRDSNIAYIQATVAGLQQIGDIISGIQANQQEASDQAIERKKKEVEDLLEAGAITEREAKQRNKRIAEEERQTKQKAAQQQKNLAVFQAFLAIPQAYISGLTAPFPIGGPIYAAILAGLAATSAAVVAARPVPKFATGKKGTYSGPGIVGDAGAELVQQDGRMWVASKPTLTYLGSKDKVFTAGETKMMLPTVNKEAIRAKPPRETFDYNKLAAAVKQKPSNTSINIDKEFISESVADGLSRVNYFDRYYSSK
jgi:uncharacterized protein YunC (DUF1805 family)